MYQGKNRTALASQRQIAGALMELMGEEPYAGITVAEICRRAGVSRQTFYSLFQSKENVVIYLLREDCGATPLKYDENEPNLRKLCREHARFVAQHRKVLQLLTDNDLIGLLQKQYHAFLISCRDFIAGFREEYRDYAAVFIAAGMTRLTEEYVRKNLDVRVMEEITYDLLCGKCRTEK